MRPAAVAQRYNQLVPLVGRAHEEIGIWARQLRQLPVMPLTPHMRRPSWRLDADASDSATAALLFDLRSGAPSAPERVHAELSERERTKSSTLREMLGYGRAIRTLKEWKGGLLRGSLVEIVGD